MSSTNNATAPRQALGREEVEIKTQTFENPNDLWANFLADQQIENLVFFEYDETHDFLKNIQMTEVEIQSTSSIITASFTYTFDQVEFQLRASHSMLQWRVSVNGTDFPGGISEAFLEDTRESPWKITSLFTKFAMRLAFN